MNKRICRFLTPMVAGGLLFVPLVPVLRAAEPIDLIPAESLLCWYGRPLPDAPPASDEPSTIQTLWELGTRIAAQPIDRGTRLSLRMAEMFGLLVRHTHAVALIDAQSRPLASDPQARRVDRLRFALVVQTGGQSEPFLRIIQKAVNEQTSSGEATLSAERAGRWEYQVLRDRRLPDWSAIAWGQIGEFFVLTVGPNVWPQLAAVAAGEEPGVSGDAWYAVARGSRGPAALIEIFVAAREIQTRLDPFVNDRASGFFRAWDAPDLEKAHWAIGLEGRALYCAAEFQIAGQTVRRLYADPAARDPRLLAMVPDGARYAVFDLPMGEFLPRFFRGLLACEDARVQREVDERWTQIQREHGFDVDRDLLAHLGRHVILHNDPPHPLRLPFALTVLIEVRDEPAAIRRTVDRFCMAWSAALAGTATQPARSPPFTLHQDADGVWFLRIGPKNQNWFGLAGPAWITTERFLIVSWSPVALREYLDKLPEDERRPARLNSE